MTNSSETGIKTSEMDHLLDELEDKETESLSLDNVDQKMQVAKEEKGNIEDLDMVSKKTNHPA